MLCGTEIHTLEAGSENVLFLELLQLERHS